MSDKDTSISTLPGLHPHQNPLETWSEKFARKFNENPWVPIGCLATCGALIMSAAKMRSGKSTEMNHWLRARVVLQGLTLVALVAGSMSLRAARIASEGNENLTDTQVAEKKKAQEKLEFEMRLRDAETTTAMEQRAGLGQNAAVNATANAATLSDAPVAAGSPAEQSTSAAIKKSSSWKFWSSGKDSSS